MTGVIDERPVAAEAGAVTAAELEPRLAEHRRELTGYCYRMLGSSFDAEDAVQDTMVRAWRSLDPPQGAGGPRPWLYPIAPNVCPRQLGRRKRPAPPPGPPAQPDPPPEAP